MFMDRRTSEPCHRILDSEHKSATTINHMKTAVKCLAQWLGLNYPGEDRLIETIPPVQLDAYLSRFYASGMKTNGQPFKRTYFFKMRTSLERYLKEHGYPNSLVRDAIFANSQAAFMKRLGQLPDTCD